MGGGPWSLLVMGLTVLMYLTFPAVIFIDVKESAS
jgi:hypothetical protein